MLFISFSLVHQGFYVFFCIFCIFFCCGNSEGNARALHGSGDGQKESPQFFMRLIRSGTITFELPTAV